MDAILETREDRLSNTHRTVITRVRPEVESVGTSITIAPGTRATLNDTLSWGSAASAERDGNHAVRVDSRFHRFRATITGGFERALGITVVEGGSTSIY